MLPKDPFKGTEWEEKECTYVRKLTLGVSSSLDDPDEDPDEDPDPEPEDPSEELELLPDNDDFFLGSLPPPLPGSDPGAATPSGLGCFADLASRLGCSEGGFSLRPHSTKMSSSWAPRDARRASTLEDKAFLTSGACFGFLYDLRGLRGAAPPLVRPRELLPRGLLIGKGSSSKESSESDKGELSLFKRGGKWPLAFLSFFSASAFLAFLLSSPNRMSFSSFAVKVLGEINQVENVDQKKKKKLVS